MSGVEISDSKRNRIRQDPFMIYDDLNNKIIETMLMVEFLGMAVNTTLVVFHQFDIFHICMTLQSTIPKLITIPIIRYNTNACAGLCVC